MVKCYQSKQPGAGARQGGSALSPPWVTRVNTRDTRINKMLSSERGGQYRQGKWKHNFCWYSLFVPALLVTESTRPTDGAVIQRMENSIKVKYLQTRDCEWFGDVREVVNIENNCDNCGPVSAGQYCVNQKYLVYTPSLVACWPRQCYSPAILGNKNVHTHYLHALNLRDKNQIMVLATAPVSGAQIMYLDPAPAWSDSRRTLKQIFSMKVNCQSLV